MGHSGFSFNIKLEICENHAFEYPKPPFQGKQGKPCTADHQARLFFFTILFYFFLTKIIKRIPTKMCKYIYRNYQARKYEISIDHYTYVPKIKTKYKQKDIILPEISPNICADTSNY